MSVTTPQILTMKLSRREVEHCVPGGIWCLDKYVPWWRSELRRRGVDRLLLVLTARNCPGCDELKHQLVRHGAGLTRALIVQAECGDLHGPSYFAIQWGKVVLRFPGVPTTLLIDVNDPEVLTLLALSLGPLTRGQEEEELSGLLQGKSRWIREAAGVPLRLVEPGAERILQLAEFDALKIPLAELSP